MGRGAQHRDGDRTSAIFRLSVPRRGAGSSLVLLESNHDPDMLRHNDHYNERLKQRILGNAGI